MSSLPGTCGQCRFATVAVNPQTREMDFTARLCKRMPPNVLLVPAGPGQMQMMNFWPTLPSDAGCFSFEKRPSVALEMPKIDAGQLGERKN